MGDIIARWEWRTFAKTIGTLIDPADYPLIRHVESSEIYLTSDSAEGNPKIRDEKIDIKTLRRVNDDGLEQWEPMLKASFPLSMEQMAALYRALYLPAPPGTGPVGFDALLAMIDADEHSWAVHVDKVRNQYDVDGCIVEASNVSFDGETFQTVAAEDPDAAKVRKTVATLGLFERENINYIKAAHRIKAGTLS
jgi:exopolyphosphatase/guanosine-5'-triphosphate,3'-diphosphate pyrophosphatase